MRTRWREHWIAPENDVQQPPVVGELLGACQQPKNAAVGVADAIAEPRNAAAATRRTPESLRLQHIVLMRAARSQETAPLVQARELAVYGRGGVPGVGRNPPCVLAQHASGAVVHFVPFIEREVGLCVRAPLTGSARCLHGCATSYGSCS